MLIKLVRNHFVRIMMNYFITIHDSLVTSTKIIILYIEVEYLLCKRHSSGHGVALAL